MRPSWWSRLRCFLHSWKGQRSLGERLGPLLFQLPPKLAFDERTAETFLGLLRGLYSGYVAFEPRHASWFTPEVSSLLATYRIARVAADPAKVPEAVLPGSWRGLKYYRLHGSPRTYYSAYSAEYLAQLADSITADAPTSEVWVIFDNTASGAALENALGLSTLVER